jgi:UDP-2,3-diacylglucosamine pyrophosphatase LpxH
MNKIKEIMTALGLEDQYSPGGALADYFVTQQSTREYTSSKQVITRHVDIDGECIGILPISDVHLGLRTCKEEDFVRFVNLIDMTPNLYTVLMGDVAESATRTSIGLGMYDERYHLDVQRDMLQQLLEPLAEQGKILGGLTGNHEMRVQYFNNDNPMKELCRDLKIPYMGYQGFIKFVVNNIVYHIMCYHGTGGGTTKGGKINAAIKPSKVANVDVYITGHIHDQIITPDVIYEIDDDTNMLVAKKRMYVSCGSFVDYFGSYAEMKCLSPSPTGMPIIYLSSTHHDIHCSI